MPGNLGLIAGWGELPFLVAQAARDQGRRVIAVAFSEETNRGLAAQVDEIHWVSIGQVGRVIKLFKAAQVSQAVLAGVIGHRHLFSKIKLDWRAISLLAKLKDKRADSILSAVASTLEKEGIKVISPLSLLKPILPGRGPLTRRGPTRQEARDIQFGYKIAKHIAGADIGQTVVVKDQAIIAVEAMEGTDACILRSGEYAKTGAVVVKVNKPRQDLRFDTPVIGPGTIMVMKKSGATVLAFDANQTLFLQKEKTVAEANRSRISLVGL